MAKIEMDIINSHCAGIDIGSKSHLLQLGRATKMFRNLEYMLMI
jgi:hypothetical protein